MYEWRCVICVNGGTWNALIFWCRRALLSAVDDDNDYEEESFGQTPSVCRHSICCCCAIHMKNLIKIKSHHNHNSSHWFQNDWGARSTTIISQQQTHPNQSKQIKWNNSSIEKFFIIRVYLIIWVSTQLVVLFAGVMVVHILFIAAVTPMLLMFRQAGRHCCRWGGYYE